MKNEKVIIVLMCIILVGIIYLFPRNKMNDVSVSNINQISTNNQIAMMYETEAGSGEYVLSSDNVWPSDGYIFNSTLSKCERGSKLSYDRTTKKVVMEANKSDKCYVYFDKNTFASFIKSLYTSNGENNLYLHDSNLANSAEDGSIRYSGSSDTTNNYVCFGSDAIPCENDNLYRIIGVFDNQVKLIKADYANSNMLGIDGDYRL